MPDRIETGTFLVGGGGDRRQADARERGLRARRGADRGDGPGRRAGALRATRRSTSTRPASGPATCARRHRDRAVPGARDRPPAADLRPAHPGERARRASTRRSSRTASSGSPSCASWAPRSTSRTPTTRPSTARPPLHGGEATISDLRAGASLILAALAADGASLIHGAHHVQRGYENIDRKFQQLGASIVRSADTA